MVLDALREKKCPGKGLLGNWEVGHGRVKVGFLKHNMAPRRQRKREKVAVGLGCRTPYHGNQLYRDTEFDIGL